MLSPGPAKKVSIYVGEDQKYRGHAVYAAILEYLFATNVSDAHVVRGMAGFGSDHKMHTARILDLIENMPVKIEFIESAEKLEEILPRLLEMAGNGLIDVQDTTVLKYNHQPESRS